MEQVRMPLWNSSHKNPQNAFPGQCRFFLIKHVMWRASMPKMSQDRLRWRWGLIHFGTLWKLRFKSVTTDLHSDKRWWHDHFAFLLCGMVPGYFLSLVSTGSWSGEALQPISENWRSSWLRSCVSIIVAVVVVLVVVTLVVVALVVVVLLLLLLLLRCCWCCCCRCWYRSCSCFCFCPRLQRFNSWRTFVSGVSGEDPTVVWM